MGFIELIPKKVYAAMVAALLALTLGLAGTAAYTKVREARAQEHFSQLQAKVANDDKERERVAYEASLEAKRMQAKHAENQQEALHEYHVHEAADAARDHARDAELDRLRALIHQYSARRGGEEQADAAACRSAADRSERLGAALEEAVGLQGEAERFIRKRDREVKLLKDTISNDRALQ